MSVQRASIKFHELEDFLAELRAAVGSRPEYAPIIRLTTTLGKHPHMPGWKVVYMVASFMEPNGQVAKVSVNCGDLISPGFHPDWDPYERAKTLQAEVLRCAGELGLYIRGGQYEP